jgi:hypothetical protein
MKTRPGRLRGRTRLARALGLGRNPLRRATDRAEAWVRVGLLGIFLVAGPMAALDAGHWAYHAGIPAPGALAAVMALAAMALALLAVLRLALAFLNRRRLAAWEAAWSRIGPQWSKRRP